VATSLSLRRLWTLYKRVAKEHGTDSRRDLILLQDAFYSGARGVLKVLEHMLRHGKQAAWRRVVLLVTSMLLSVSAYATDWRVYASDIEKGAKASTGGCTPAEDCYRWIT